MSLHPKYKNIVYFSVRLTCHFANVLSKLTIGSIGKMSVTWSRQCFGGIRVWCRNYVIAKHKINRSRITNVDHRLQLKAPKV